MPANRAPRVDAAQRDARALELRAAGATYRQIAERLGCSVDTAWKAVDRGLVRTRQEPADKLRRLERVRLDRLQRAAETVLGTTHHVLQGGEAVLDEKGKPYVDHGPTLNAIRTLLAVQERRAKLLGLDAPARLDAQVRAEVYSVDALQAEIARLEQELAPSDALPPPAENPAAEPAEELLAEAVAAGLTAAGVDLDDAALDRLAGGVEGYLRRRNGGQP
jgi:hypothetical protein